MRYQVVDCRWELGNPARGRELYLAVQRQTRSSALARPAAPPAEHGDLAAAGAGTVLADLTSTTAFLAALYRPNRHNDI